MIKILTSAKNKEQKIFSCIFEFFKSNVCAKFRVTNARKKAREE